MLPLFPSIGHPWKERFEREFFAQIPKEPGVYRFFSKSGGLLYVGKAKNLNARVRQYRYQNVESAPRKLKRLLAATFKIEWATELSEMNALLSENRLLRELKPIFNRMNTHPEYYVYLVAEKDAEKSSWSFTPTWQLPESLSSKRVFGAFRSKKRLRSVLASMLRLQWLAAHADRDFWQLPQTWMKDEVHGPASFEFAEDEEKKLFLEFWAGRSPRLLLVWTERLLARESLDAFLRSRIQDDLDRLQSFYQSTLKRLRQILRAQLKGKRLAYIPREEIDDRKILLAFDA